MGKIAFINIRIGLLFCLTLISFSTFGVSEMNSKNRFKVTKQEIPERLKEQQKGKKQSWLKKLFSKKKQKTKRKRNPIFSILALIILFSTAFSVIFFAGILLEWLVSGFALFSILGFLQTKIWKGRYKEKLAKSLFWLVAWSIGIFLLLIIFFAIFIAPSFD